MNAVSSPLDTQSLKSVGDPTWLENRENNSKGLSLSTKRNQVVVVVVKVEYKIKSGLPPSYKCSYQSQIGAKPNCQSNLLVSVGKQLQDEPVLTEVYVELWTGTI